MEKAMQQRPADLPNRCGPSHAATHSVLSQSAAAASADHAAEAAQTKLDETINQGPGVAALRALSEILNDGSRVAAQRKRIAAGEKMPRVAGLRALGDMMSGARALTAQAKRPLGAPGAVAHGEGSAPDVQQHDIPMPAAPRNQTGLPDGLKAGVEALSGISLDAVRVHHDSSRPAELNAHAYAQGTDIHLAPGQAQHLPHEAWHVVQQARGAVKPTMQTKSGVPVNDDKGLEQEADVMGARALTAAVQRQARVGAVAAASGAAQAMRSRGARRPGRPAIPRAGGVGAGQRVVQRQPDFETQKAAIAYFEKHFADDEFGEKIAEAKSLLNEAQKKNWEDLEDMLLDYVREHEDESTSQYFDSPAYRNKQKDGYYPPEVSVNRGKDGKVSIDRQAIASAVKNSSPSVQSVEEVLTALKSDLLEKDLGLVEPLRARLVEIENLPKEARDAAVRAFLNVYGLKKKDGKVDAAFLAGTILLNVLKTAIKQQDAPKIGVGGKPLETGKADFSGLKPGASMDDIEKTFDVLARKSSSHAESIDEVDMAFLDETRGISDYWGGLKDGKPAITGGGDNRLEKVFAIGHGAAINFEGKLSNVGGERYYAVLFPKGFIARYGADLRTEGSGGKSAKEPSDKEFAEHTMTDNKKKIDIGADKAFAIRSEKATPKGQVGIHFGFTNMDVHGKKTSHLQFFRSFTLGVVEFDENGRVLYFKLFS